MPAMSDTPDPITHSVFLWWSEHPGAAETNGHGGDDILGL
jgi:hypothetical protein